MPPNHQAHRGGPGKIGSFHRPLVLLAAGLLCVPIVLVSCASSVDPADPKIFPADRQTPPQVVAPNR